jgi:hypothetical protein
MTEEALPTGTVTPLKARAAVAEPDAPEAAATEIMTQEATEVTLAAAAPVPAAALIPPPAVQDSPRRLLQQRLQELTTRTFPIAWYRVTRVVGPAGLVGAAATLAAILIGVLALVGERHAADALSAQIAHAQAHPTVAAVNDAGVSKVVADLPRRQDIPLVVGTVLAQARAANVVLDNGHYNYSAPKGGTVGRYELEFPVKADYPSVRDFINRTLSAVPAAGLDKLHIERKAVGDPIVSADIRFVVFVRAEP